MTIGMGLFLLGVYLSLAAAYAAPSVSSKGMATAQLIAIVTTAISLFATVFKLA